MITYIIKHLTAYINKPIYIHTSTIYKQIQTYNTIQIYKSLYLYITPYINKEYYAHQYKYLKTQINVSI